MFHLCFTLKELMVSKKQLAINFFYQSLTISVFTNHTQFTISQQFTHKKGEAISYFSFL